MTNDEKRIAIAEVCGWIVAVNPNDGWGSGAYFPYYRYTHQLPDYLNDLNAMHSALAAQSAGFHARYDVEFRRLMDVRGKCAWQMTSQDWADCFIWCLQSQRDSGN